MNELKPEDVMRALECWASGKPCQEECLILEHEEGASCLKLTARSALALLREKDAILEMCAETIERQDKEIAEKDAEIERLKKLHEGFTTKFKAEFKADAISEFAERLKERMREVYPADIYDSDIDQIAYELKGESK